LVGSSATITNANVTTGTVGTLVGSSATITNANVTTGTVGTLVGSSATITNANVTTGTVGTLVSTNANVTTSSVGTLVGSSATITNANVTTGTVGTLISTNANVTTSSVGTLVGSSATITNANVTTSSIGTLVGSSATLSTLSVIGGGGLSVTNNISSAGLTVGGNGLVLNGEQNVTNITPSTSTTTGAIRVSGGVGIAGSVNVGGTINAPNANVTTGTVGTLLATNANVTTSSVGTLVGSSATITNSNVTTETVGTLLATNANVTTGTIGTLLSTIGRFRSDLNVDGNLQVGNTTGGYLVNFGTSGSAGYRSGYLFGDGTHMRLLNQQAGFVSIATNNGSNQFRIVSSGNVGINIENPTYRLDVDGSFRATSGDVTLGTLLVTNANITTGTVGTLVGSSATITNANVTTSTIGTSIITGNVGIGTVSPSGRLHLVQPTADSNIGTVIQNGSRQYTIGIRGDTSNSFAIQDDTASAFRMVINTAGNVGFGTSLPTYRVDIGGSVRATSGDITLGSLLTSTANVTTGTVGTLVSSTANITTGTVGTLVSSNVNATTVSGSTVVATTYTGGSMSLSGNLTLAGTLTTVNITTTNISETNVSAGSVSATNIGVTTQTTGTSRITSNLLALGNSNTVGNIFTTGGNVGIATTSPTFTLDVSGSARMGGNGFFRFTNDADPYAHFGGSTMSGDARLNVQDRNGALISYYVSTTKIAGMSLVNNNALYINMGSNGTNQQIALADQGSSGFWGFGAANGAVQYMVGSGASGLHVFYTNSTTGQSNAALGTERMRIAADGKVTIGGALQVGTNLLAVGNSNTVGNIFTTGGNVGIGVTNPVTWSQLHLKTPSSVSGAFVYLDATTSTSGKSYAIGSSLSGNISGGGNLEFYDATSDAARMVIGSSGNVGIANNTPGYRLDVSGSFRATSGDVTLGSTLVTNSNVTTQTTGTSRITTSLLAVGNSNTVGNIFTTGGNVGIGISSPTSVLNVLGAGSGGTIRTYPSTNGQESSIGFYQSLTAGNYWVMGQGSWSTGVNFGIGYQGTGNIMLLSTSGNVTVVGDITAFGSVSDARFKENIQNIQSEFALDKIKSLRPVTFTWKDNIANTSKIGTEDAGFIAQEVEEVIEYAVDDFEEIGSGDTYKKIKHERIIPYLVGAIQRLEARIAELEKQN
jgi:hypothetical protein